MPRRWVSAAPAGASATSAADQKRRLREAELLTALAAGPHPARNPQQNLADLRAQLERQAQELESMHVSVHMHVASEAEPSTMRVSIPQTTPEPSGQTS
mgnify:CR=1 FL=1